MTDSEQSGATELRTIAYSYGCPAGTDLDQDGAGQLRLAHQMWNTLVAMQRAHQAAKDAVWRQVTAVAAAMDVAAAAQRRCDDVRDRMASARSQDRTTVPRDSDVAALDAARAARRAAKIILDAARAQALPGLREQFGALLAERYAVMKAAYGVFGTLGLGWGTRNDILRRRFPAAVSKVEQRRGHGLPADLRFRKWDGSGTLTVQVQHQAGQPPRTVPALNSGMHPMSGVLRIEGWQDTAERPRGAARHGTLVLRAGRARGHAPLMLRIPVVLDRQIPAGAEVREVKVSRRVTGRHARLSVSVICDIEAASPAAGGAVVAVRSGWASAGDGWITVARIGSSVPLPPLPRSLAGGVPGSRKPCRRGRGARPDSPQIVRVAAGGLSAEVLMPPEWREVLDRDDRIRSYRDQELLDPVRDKVAAALADPVLCDAAGVTAAEVARWRSPRRFAWLAQSWPADHELRPVLDDWRRRDAHLHDYECFSSDTEVLTRDGWRPFPKVSLDDELATVDLGTDLITYQRPSRIIARPYTGRMVQVGGRSRQRIDLLVTPRHRMVVISQDTGRPRVKMARDLVPHDNIKIRAHWAGRPSGTVTLPPSRYYPEADISPIVLAAFLGWYLSEGYCNRSRPTPALPRGRARVVIYQSLPPGRKAIRAVLDALPWTYQETVRGFVISNDQAHALVADLGQDAYTKHIPQWIKDAEPDVIRAFTDAAIAGDGWRHGRTVFYGTVSPRLADDMQELFVKLGLATSMSRRDGRPCVFPGKPVYQGRDLFTVIGQARSVASLRNSRAEPAFRMAGYTGTVHCATVPNGTLIVRRNGKVAICGNCHERAQVLARRRDAWRCAAAWLCTGAGSVLLDGVDIAGLRQVPDADREDPEFPARAGRRQLHRAAPGELREAVRAAAAARRIPVTDAVRPARGSNAEGWG